NLANAIRLQFPANSNSYTGATTFFTQPASANTAAVGAVIFFNNPDQVPDGSAVTVTTSPMGTRVGLLNLFGKSDTWGSLAGNGTGVTSSASLANTTVTVGNGTTVGALGGNGSIAGPVTVTSTGHLAPAMTPSTTNTLTINNNLTLNAGATLDYNFGASAS